jgi:hypothetical protein
MRRRVPTRVLVWIVLLAALAVGAVVSAQRSSARSSTAMATAAAQLLASLSAEERQLATFPFDGQERLRWHYIPSETFPRNGLMLKDMTEPQRALAFALMRSALSQRGYETYSSIIELETVLKAIERSTQLDRNPLLYRFSVFGTPSATGTWGWRVEGHHVSLHFTVANGQAVASTPSFAGSNPAEVREGPAKGRRILAAQEDAGRALVTALDAAQRSSAIVGDVAPGEILTSNKLEISPLSPPGIRASQLSEAQRALLTGVLDAFAGLMAPDIASDRMAKVRTAGLENVTFAWAGPLERGQKHYYRVQGPTFLIEFDNTQNNGNHVHSIWRDFTGDFGRDLLREHVRSAHGGGAASGAPTE